MDALEALCGDSIIPPERDNYVEDIDKREYIASFKYACLDIRNNLGTEEFKEIYMVQVPYVKNASLQFQRRFLIEIQEKIAEIYDWEFPDEWALVDTLYQQEQLYEFIEFLEYDNYRFLSYVWKFLLDDIMKLLKLDIKKFCDSDPMKIIKETEEQLETHSQNKLITIFLRSFYKEKYIEWFIKNTEKNKSDIMVELLDEKILRT